MSTLLCGSDDKTIKVWDLRTRACLGTFCVETAILCVAVSRSNALAAGDLPAAFTLFEIRP